MFVFCKRDVLPLLIGLRKLLFIIKFYIYLYKRIINCCGLCASHKSHFDIKEGRGGIGWLLFCLFMDFDTQE